MRRCFLPLTCVVVLLTAGVPGGSAQTALEFADKARKELQTQYDAKKEERKKSEEAWKGMATAATTAQVQSSQQEEFALQGALSNLQAVRSALVSGESENALQQLGAISRGANLPNGVHTALDAIGQCIRAEQADKMTVYNKEIDTAYQAAAAAVLQAKEPKDLDSSLKDLQRVSDLPTPNRYADARNLASRLRYAITFVIHWQDYLIARSRNEEGNVRTILQNLNQESSLSLIPRSEILARVPLTDSEREATFRTRRGDTGQSQTQIDADALDIVRGVKKLDEVSAALTKLVELRTEETQLSHNYRSDSVLNSALAGMEGLQRSFLEYRNGLSPEIGRLLTGTEYASHPEINLMLWSLRLQLVRESAPHLMGVSADEKPGDDEPLGGYLHRLIESAKAKQDWAAVIRGLQILRMVTSMGSNSYGYSNDQDVTAFQSLLAASNMEKAGQYRECVTLYLTALRNGQQDLPAAWIGEHLTAIQKAHPEDYSRGVGYASSEPQAAYGEMLRIYRTMVDQRAADSLNPVTPSSPRDPQAAAVSPSPAPPAPVTPAPVPSPSAPAIPAPSPKSATATPAP